MGAKHTTLSCSICLSVCREVMLSSNLLVFSWLCCSNKDTCWSRNAFSALHSPCWTKHTKTHSSTYVFKNKLKHDLIKTEIIVCIAPNSGFVINLLMTATCLSFLTLCYNCLHTVDEHLMIMIVNVHIVTTHSQLLRKALLSHFPPLAEKPALQAEASSNYKFIGWDKSLSTLRGKCQACCCLKSSICAL